MMNVLAATAHFLTTPAAFIVVLGILILAWGGLEFGRPWLRQLFPSADLDWVIFAILLIGWGLILLVRAIPSAPHKQPGTLVSASEE